MITVRVNVTFMRVCDDYCEGEGDSCDCVR